MAFFWPRNVNPSSAFSVRQGRALHRIAAVISATPGAAALIALAIAAYQAVINSGEWANDYWFNPDWMQTASWGALALVTGLAAWIAGWLIRYLLSKQWHEAVVGDVTIPAPFP